jgi:hypothetical protein
MIQKSGKCSYLRTLRGGTNNLTTTLHCKRTLYCGHVAFPFKYLAYDRLSHV